MSGYFGIKGVEGGFEILGELVEGLFRVGSGGICHFVIPGFSIGGTSSAAHLVQGGHDLGGIGSVECRVQGEIGLHGLDPLGGIIVFAREIGWEGSL